MTTFETNFSNYMSLHISSAILRVFTGGLKIVGEVDSKLKRQRLPATL
jgi:hypothetical protein